jgi:hypothetical protein
MSEKVKEVQEYLHKKGIDVSETAIIDAAFKIATRWGGNLVFVCEFRKEKEDGQINNGRSISEG